MSAGLGDGAFVHMVKETNGGSRISPLQATLPSLSSSKSERSEEVRKKIGKVGCGHRSSLWSSPLPPLLFSLLLLNQIQNIVATRLGVGIRESKMDTGRTVMGEKIDSRIQKSVRKAGLRTSHFPRSL